MAKTYQWRAKADFKSNVGDDTLLTSGAIPATQENWQTANIGEDAPGSGQWGYYFHDANVSVGGYYTDANASRVLFTISQTWRTSVDQQNNLTVTISSTISSIVRDNAVGINQNTPGRHIQMYQQAGASPVFDYTDLYVAENHSILTTPIVLDNYSFTLPPGENKERSALFVHNQTVGYPWYDEVWVGVTFRNTLPAPTIFVLNYDANGGTGAPSAQTATSGDETQTFTVSSTQPTWGYYKFLGWSTVRHTESATDADVEYRAGDTLTISDTSPTVTLYAVWMKDYRPGATLNTNTNIWRSHDRANGACHILPNTTGTNWHECRTIGGDSGAQGNPPLILKAANANSWYNQKRIGKP